MNTVRYFYEEISNDYIRLTNQLQGLQIAKNALYTISKNLDLEFEVNGYPWDEFYNENGYKDIEWVRVENYGCLDYIYFRYENGELKHIYFDVAFRDETIFDNVRYSDISREAIAEALKEK